MLFRLFGYKRKYLDIFGLKSTKKKKSKLLILSLFTIWVGIRVQNEEQIRTREIQRIVSQLSNCYAQHKLKIHFLIRLMLAGSQSHSEVFELNHAIDDITADHQPQ